MSNSEKLIKKLQMLPHPEGGHFKESYRDKNISLIYYLLKKNEKSHWHRLKKNEILHFYDGAPLIVYLSTDGNTVQEVIINNNTSDAEKSNSIKEIKIKQNFEEDQTNNVKEIKKSEIAVTKVP